MIQTWRIVRFIARRWLDWLKALIGCVVALVLAIAFGMIWTIRDWRAEEKDWTE